MTSPRFSLVIPIYNEEENVQPVLAEIEAVLGEHGPMEVLVVDDCSSDGSLQRAVEFRNQHDSAWLRILGLRSRSGQSAAVLAGAELAQAPIIMTMDGDRQNDPRDLLRMLELLEAGDCQGVTGVRAVRQDSWLRRQSSSIGNAVRNLITGDRVTDSACGIKAYGRECFLRAPRFDGMHRFMASLVRYQGGKVLEIPVTHRARATGQSKYGIGNRGWRGLRDCFAVRWLRGRSLNYQVREHREAR